MSARSGQSAVDHGGHAVQFYGDDAELSASVGAYLGEGLVAGGSAVVVATKAHRAGFRAGLAAAGVDGDAAESGGRLLMVDAAEMLRGFMAGDRLDHSRFRAAAGDLISRAAGAGQPVRIYAEMVALLWDAGQVTLALELETLWNDMASLLPFCLLCGYPVRVAAGNDNAGAVEEVCRLHTGVVAPYPGLPGMTEVSVNGSEAVRSFPCAGASARAAREFVVERLCPRVDQAVVVDAAIVTAELASNAVLHARSAFTVAVWRPEDCVRIAVRDTAPLPPGGELLWPVPGHGLDVVAKVADRWAVEPLPNGKRVWVELPSSPEGPSEVRW